MKSTLREYKSPRKRFRRQHLATLATLTILRPAGSKFRKQSPVYGVFDRYFHIPLPIVTKHLNLVFPFPLGTFA